MLFGHTTKYSSTFLHPVLRTFFPTLAKQNVTFFLELIGVMLSVLELIEEEGFLLVE